MKKIILILLLLLFLVGCESYAGQLPESICIKTQDLKIINNGSNFNIDNAQVEVQLKGCEFGGNES